MANPAGFTQHVSGYWMRSSDQAGPFIYDGTNIVPVTPPSNMLNSASGNVANANAVATLAAAAGKTTFISGFEITATGATVGLPVTVTVTGILGGTLSYTFAAPAGALLIATPLTVLFNPPLSASAANTAIVVTLPPLGVGNTNASANAHGYQA